MRPQYALVLSTLLIRLGAGLIITHVVVSALRGAFVGDSLAAACALALVLVGVTVSATHLGKPKRLLNAFANPSSMLTWEAILTPLLLLSTAALGLGTGAAVPAAYLAVAKAASAGFGAALIYVTAKVYHLRARPSWTTPIVIYEFLLSAACMGLLGYLSLAVLASHLPSSAWVAMNACIALGVVAEGATGFSYRRYVRQASPSAAEVLQDKDSLAHHWVWVFFGVGVPFALAAGGAAAGRPSEGLAWGAFGSFCLGAVSWRILFFKVATPIKITPEIAQ